MSPFIFQQTSQQLNLDDLQNKSGPFLSCDEGEIKPIGSEMNDSGSDSRMSLSVAMSSFRSMESSKVLLWVVCGKGVIPKSHLDQP